MRIFKFKTLDNAVKSIMVDDSQMVSNLMVLICTRIGITNHEEYSLVWDKPQDEQENLQANRTGTLGGTLTLKRVRMRDGDKEIDPKMEELKRNLHTEDGGKLTIVNWYMLTSLSCSCLPLVHWVDHGKTLREQGIVESDILLLKRKYFYSDANIDSRDPIQLNLLYQQAKEAILNATHPVTQEDAVTFAAFQAQVQFGDYRESTHKPGFLE